MRIPWKRVVAMVVVASFAVTGASPLAHAQQPAAPESSPVERADQSMTPMVSPPGMTPIVPPPGSPAPSEPAMAQAQPIPLPSEPALPPAPMPAPSEPAMAQAQPMPAPPVTPAPPVPAPPAPATPPPPPAPPAGTTTMQPDLFQETLKSQQRASNGKQALYATGAVVTNIFLIPGRMITCTLGAGIGIGILAITFGTGYKTAAGAWDEGCGGKWVVSGDDLRPDAGRAFEWER